MESHSPTLNLAEPSVAPDPTEHFLVQRLEAIHAKARQRQPAANQETADVRNPACDELTRRADMMQRRSAADETKNDVISLEQSPSALEELGGGLAGIPFNHRAGEVRETFEGGRWTGRLGPRSITLRLVGQDYIDEASIQAAIYALIRGYRRDT